MPCKVPKACERAETRRNRQAPTPSLKSRGEGTGLGGVTIGSWGLAARGTFRRGRHFRPWALGPDWLSRLARPWSRIGCDLGRVAGAWHAECHLLVIQSCHPDAAVSVAAPELVVPGRRI